MTQSPMTTAETVFAIPTLRTERLILRAPVKQDLPHWTRFFASDRAAYIGGPKNEADSYVAMAALIGHWAIHGYGRWMLVNPDNDDVLGSVGLFFPVGWPEPEIAWTLFDHAEGNGYALEAAIATRDYAYRELGFETLASCVIPGNDRSVALAERMGAHFEGLFEHHAFGTMHVYRHLSPQECSITAS